MVSEVQGDQAKFNNNNNIPSANDSSGGFTKKGNVSNGYLKHRHVTVDIRKGDYENYMKKHPSAKLIGINGKWYEISNFIPHHPGGNVIEKFVGKDASPLFKSFHEKDVLKHRKPVGSFTTSRADPAALAFAELHDFFAHKGFFQTSLTWYVLKVCVTFLFLAVAVFLIAGCRAWYCHYLAALFLAGFWQQSGFFMHDFMHNQVFHSRHIDQWLGTFFGTVCLGVSGSWWRDEHFIHHALVNGVDIETKFCDPQMVEPTWAQNEKLFPLFTTPLQRFAVSIQHFTFLPLCVGVGRVGIILDSFKAERRGREICAGILHWCWVSLLFSYLPTWHEVLVVYGMSCVCQGILHVQLLISHYAKPFYDVKHVSEEDNWYRIQVECNINISNPVWLDWFHGGLNFHIEHHLYPTMPRHHYREASVYIKRVCSQLGMLYEECCWSDAVVRTLKHLKNMSEHFSLDPR